ncbi:uncharacterized protein LOC144632769 isoform X2 [Oculina patagonica]
MMSLWEKFLSLFVVLHLASGAWGQVAGVKYFMATCGGQNCDLVCGTFGFQCARTGQSFPPTSALSIFESLGIRCKTPSYQDNYQYKDHPNYVAESPDDKVWVGMCLGFKSIPSTIDCHTANNTLVRRLCPCYDPLVTQPPVSSSPNLSTTTKSAEEVTTSRGSSAGTAIKPHTTTATKSETEVTSGIGYTTTEEQSTGNEVGTGLPQQQIGARGEAERTALIVVAVIAAGLVLCLLGVAFLFMWNRRRFRGKTGSKPDNVKFHVGYHKNNNEKTAPDMMDGLTVETSIDEENSYCEMKSAGHSLNNAKNMKVKSLADDPRYENTCVNEKATDNILYASVPEGTNMALVTDNNIPLYDR